MSLNQAAATQQLQQDLHNGLTTANHLLQLISLELQQIKKYTIPGGPFESNIKKNASLMESLASIQQVDLENLPPLTRTRINLNNTSNLSYEQHNTFRDSSNLELSK